MRSRFAGRILRFGLDVLAPVLHPLFWTSEKIYDLLFGRADIRLSKEAEQKLSLEIRAKLEFLFDRYGGQLQNDETVGYPRPFDYAVVIVTLDAFSMRFIRGRRELTVQIAGKSPNDGWQELPTVLGLIDGEFEQPTFSSLQEVAATLEPRIERLSKAFSAAEYPHLQQKLANARAYDQAVIRQWETELNKRLFSDK